MSAKLQKLTFSIDLLDRVSGPVRKVTKSLTCMAGQSERAFAQIGTGAAGVAGAGLSLMGMINPAEQMRQAMGEVASLGVEDTVLKGLSDQALQYSIKYGRAADGFVRSAYDIQSAIGGLEGNDLAVFTNAGNVLATATKSDAGTITNYMGTMYGIFQKEADKMGKADWIEQLTGQTATAVKMFKTTGSEMSAAFTSVGANATAAGIGAVEQMAVLGKLQATMSGSEAGTKYKSFLAGVGQAQKKLGLSFVDGEGKMLPMIDILEKIQGKFGSADKLADSDLLKQAFGSEEASSLLKLLMQDTNGLATAMDTLGQVKGMEEAEKMAAHMVTPLQRIWQGVLGVTTALGQGLNPALDPLINGMADAAATMTGWMTKYPNLTKYIGGAVLVVFSMVAAMGALSMVMGLSRLGLIGLGPAITAVKWAMALFTKHAILAKVGTFLWQTALVAGHIALGALKGTLLIFKGVMWLVNAAMAANPAILITMAIIGLVAAVAAAIYWWDDLKAAFLDTSWGQAIMKVIDLVMGGFKAMGDPIGWVSDKIGAVAGFFGFGGDDKAASPSLEATKRTASVPGGMTKHIANTVANTSNNSRTIGKQEINIHTPVDRQALQELNWMEA